MRFRSFATTTALTGVIALTGAANAFAADPGPTTGVAANSPGVISGNTIQVPVGLGLNLCGNSIDIIGLLNPAGASSCQSG
ncbi:chaplin [Streptomyces sp. 5-8]|uniref:Chaplin n=2 Tax=Streptomyces TaxID=1883 RepID=A0ABS1NVP0_9ACTN|nr:chaplin [Streptomyces musisoli]MBY8840252.1 chaplin [Streptomyces sp. SP2-10]